MKQHVSKVNKVLSVVSDGTLLSSLVDSKKIRDTLLQQYTAKKLVFVVCQPGVKQCYIQLV